MALRCLPIHTRKLFEVSSSAAYLSIAHLLYFVRSRVAILEVVDDPHKNSVSNVPFKGVRLTGQVHKRGEQESDKISDRCL